MNLAQYIEVINKRYKTGISSEHTYRTDLETLIRELVPGVDITNEPSNVTDCGNPDYVITKGKIPIGFIEAKDIGKDLNSKQYKEQFSRYRKALDNLIITDYLWFQFFQNGELVHEIRIAEINGNNIESRPDSFDEFTNLMIDFCSFISQTIKSPKKLAEMMAAKARLLENILEKAITSDEKTDENTALQQQYKTFKEILIHDLSPEAFADIYAQTIAYGMFAARLHDKTLDDFSRHEAVELIPKSNPFLRNIFAHIAGHLIDERIITTVDNLADVFRATNVESLLKNFGKGIQSQDPIIHFYETFLSEYDPKLREIRGVWYTPKPVVEFIVRGVDEILKKEFGLKDGLADTSKTTIEVEAQGTAITKGRNKGKRLTETIEVHKVQVLDAATGTGTFLAEVVNYIYNNKFESMQGAWSGYVEEHLIPRLNGFELLMASYSMAHLKLDMLLTETGYKSKKDQRFNIFLTNSLEEHHPDTGTLFSSWLSREANEANYIKRDIPIMVILGNPPYSKSSYNKGHWIEGLMEDYKTTIKDTESQIQALSNDYIKFIRYSQYMIDKNGSGILFLITGHGYLEGPVTKDMRKSIMDSFNKLYIIDLNGSIRREYSGSEFDENVFDILQGVSIIAAVKTSERKKVPTTVYHHSLIGSRESKYGFLNKESLHDIDWEKHIPREPKYDFTPYASNTVYESYFCLTDLFGTGNPKKDKEKRWATGFTSQQDQFAISFTAKDSICKINELILSSSKEELANKYRLCSSGQWDYEKAKQYLSDNKFEKEIEKVCYRPFDQRYTMYNRNVVTILRGIRSYFKRDNLCFISTRKANDKDFAHVFVSTDLVDKIFIGNKTSTNAYCFPLYVYPDKDVIPGNNDQRIPNLNSKLVNEIAGRIGKKFVKEKLNDHESFCPVDIFDYVYSVLHSPKYRAKYNELLKKDYPRIPYPEDEKTFWKLVMLGGELRKIHLLESSVVEKCITSYPQEGDNIVSRKIAKKDWEFYDKKNQLGRIWINDNQYIDKIPLKAWEFYIGGYQPAQKWLKDRKGRKLSFDDIRHYQKIIVALMETYRIMKEIDKVFKI